MLLKADNRPIIIDQPTTVLTASVAAGGTSLTVKNNGGFAQNDYVLIGRIGEEKSEIKRITAAVTAGTALTVTVTFAHDEDTPITKVDYDQAEFSHTTTVAGSKTVMTTANIDPTEIYTFYEDTTYTTGYGFSRYKDSNAATYSVYSDAIPYTGYTSKMLRRIRSKVRQLLNETDEGNSPLTNEEINDEINLAQKEIAHSRLWSWYEETKSFSSVADQYEYTLATNCFVLYDAKYDSQPLAVADLHRWNILRWDSDVSGDPTHICMWRKKARVYPYPSSSATATAINDADDITASDTTITVDSTSGFREQGRIIIDSEVISYTGTTSTTLTGCVRGEEGTTAAIHLNNAVITERDFIYHFQEDPDDLTDETDETSIPDPSILAYKAGAELALQLDNETLHDRLLIKYDRAYKQLVKIDESKYKSTFGRVKESSEVINDAGVWRNPNDYPQNITGV